MKWWGEWSRKINGFRHAFYHTPKLFYMGAEASRSNHSPEIMQPISFPSPLASSHPKTRKILGVLSITRLDLLDDAAWVCNVLCSRKVNILFSHRVILWSWARCRTRQPSMWLQYRHNENLKCSAWRQTMY